MRSHMTILRVFLVATAAIAVSLVALSAAPDAAPPKPNVFDYNAGAPLKATTKLEAETDVTRIFKVTFRGAEGQRVPALLGRPKGASGSGPCVLVGHPATGSKEEEFSDKADAYAARGVTMLAIDARYHGERQGIGVLRAIARLDTLYKLFRLTVIDTRRALDYLDSRGLCDPARIGYEGRSMGGFIGSMLIGVDPRIKAGAFLVSGANWRVYLKQSWVMLGGNLSGARLNAAVRKLDPIDPRHCIRARMGARCSWPRADSMTRPRSPPPAPCTARPRSRRRCSSTTAGTTSKSRTARASGEPWRHSWGAT